MTIHDSTLTAAELQSIMTGRDGADLTSAGAPRGSMRLIDVTPGSITERLGGCNGDIIQSLNGAPLSDVPKAYAAAFAAIDTRRVVIAGTRDGAPFTLTITLAA